MRQSDPRNVPVYLHIIKFFQTPNFTNYPQKIGSNESPCEEAATAVSGVEAAEATPVPATLTEGAGEGTVNRHLEHARSLAGGFCSR